MPRWEVRFDLRVDVESPDIVRLVAEAEALARVIRGVPIPPYIRLRLDRLNILRAVRGTTGIEGSDLSEDEVGAVLASDLTPALPRPREREEREVRNAARVMEHISSLLRRDPAYQLTQSAICEVHAMITDGIDYANNRPGVYRSRQVRAGTYVPPEDHDTLVRLMSEFERWMREPPASNWPRIVRAIAAHFYFLSIHPFGDGNGRTARALESFLLYQARVNVLGFYSLSNFYYRQRPEYIDHLDQARFRSKGDLTPFIKFALVGLVEELEAVHREVLDAIAEITFRDLANEALLHRHDLGRKVRERLYQLLIGLTRPVKITDIRSGRHQLSSLYASLSAKTLTRDIQHLREAKLIVMRGGIVQANLALMRDYLP